MPCPHVEELNDRILPAVTSMPIIAPPIETSPPVVSFQSNPSAAANAVVLQQVNGSTDILVAGYDTINGNQDFALWRFSSDGSVDTTFGNGGLVTTDFGPGTGSDMAQALAIAIDPTTGDIVLAGSAFNSAAGNLDFAVAVYKPDGTPDSNFGSKGGSVGPAGTITTDFGSGGDAQINALAFDPSADQIVVAGYAWNGMTYNIDFALARYNLDGSLDGNFGSGGSFGPAGTITTDFGSGAQANALVVDAAGNYVVGGSAYNSATGTNDFAMARFNSAGNLDPSFGASGGSFGPAGTVTTDFGASDSQISALAVTSSGQYVVAGSAYNATTQYNDFALARYNADGSLDTSFGASPGSFGPAGTVTTDFGSGYAQVNALAVDTAGRYVAGGNAFNSTTGSNDFALARYNADGNLDTTFGVAGSSFGPAGTVTEDFGSGDAQVNGLVIDGNGNYVMAGLAFDGTTASNGVALAHMDTTGNLDSTFAAGNGGFGPSGTLTWQPAGTVPLPPPTTDGGGPVLPPVLLNGPAAPGSDGSVGPVSDGSMGPIGPQPEVIAFDQFTSSSITDNSASTPNLSTVQGPVADGTPSAFTGSHLQETLSTGQGSSANSATLVAQQMAAADIAFFLVGSHGAESPGAVSSETVLATTAGPIPVLLNTALPGQVQTIVMPTAISGTSAIHNDAEAGLPTGVEESGTDQSNNPFAAPAALQPTKTVPDMSDSTMDSTATPQTPSDDGYADDADDPSDG
jgi:uncharacterized delta-60 repeat protein